MIDRVLLIIEAVNRRGLFAARLAENSRLLCTSTTPFTDAARVLLREGVDPKTILISRKAGQDYHSMRSSVGGAAKLTVNESRTVFAPWKPFSPSAVSPSISHPTEQPPAVAAAPSALPQAAREQHSQTLATEPRRPRSAPPSGDDCVDQIELNFDKGKSRSPRA